MQQGIAQPAPSLVEGRQCGSCNMCCKVFAVPPVGSRAGEWCRHVVHGKGCGIHATRPDICRDFFCQWLQNATLGPEWQPRIAHFVLSLEPGTGAVIVSADPGSPLAWQKEPYYSQLRRWAHDALINGRQVVAFVRDQVTVILPNRDVPLGAYRAGDQILVAHDGTNWHVELKRSGDT